MSHNLPHRFREETFRIYEPTLREIVSRFPLPVRFDPRLIEKTPHTFAARLRDSIISLLANKWPTDIDMAKLREIRPKFVIRELDSGEVMVGPPQAATTPSTTPPLSGVGFVAATPFAWQSKEDLFLLARLAHERLLICPLVLKDVPTDIVNDIQNLYDVSVETNTEGETTLT